MIKDLKELKKLIVENPKCKLLTFCGEDAWSGEFGGYEYGQDVRVKLVEMAEFKSEFSDARLLEKDDYKEELQEQMVDNPKYAELFDEEFFIELKHEMSKIKFEKVIAIYIG